MITGKSRLICSLGDPVSHSLSPLMHNEGFRYLGLDYAYLCFRTGVAEVEDTIAALKRLNARGFSCTMPIKVRVCQVADQLSPAAKLMGAVNAAIIEENKVIGYNTDGIGYVTALRNAGYNFENQKITLLGGGGVATAMAVQLALDGASEISIFNRQGKSFMRAEDIGRKIEEQTACRVKVCDMADKDLLRAEIAESYILTNGTSVGMAPNIDQSPIDDFSMLYEGLIVTDAIYNPKETTLLTNAKLRGCHILGGLDMLLYQGAAAFKIWTGEEMPVDAVREKVFK